MRPDPENDSGDALAQRSCRFYARLLHLYPARLELQYGEEMQLLFHEQLRDAATEGATAVGCLWLSIARDTLLVLGPVWVERLSILTASTLAASALVTATVLGFCSSGAVGVVHGYSDQTPAPLSSSGQRLATSRGQMFLECIGNPTSRTPNRPTVILATGRGIGDHTGWSPVQSRVSAFARVCSYDPLGAGESDHTPGSHPVAEIVRSVHDLFQAAHLRPPFVMAGTSLGGVLVRQYEQQYPAEIAGLVFVDSAHEEMEWRDAAIATGFDPSWNDPRYLSENGLLPPQQRLTWHDDVPLIVLERAEKPPCSAFPGLTDIQCDQINAAWHSFQVDLARRSTMAELRTISGAGHAMVWQKPDAVAAAIHDVLDHIAVPAPSTQTSSLDAAARQRVLTAVVAALRQFYLDPRVGNRMADALLQQAQAGHDRDVTGGAAFAALLTRQMRDISHDRHLIVEYSASPTPARPPGPDPENQARFRADMERTHCTIERAAMLSGNVGYLKINEFPDPAVCRSSVMAAMQQLNGAGALIVDLRDNHGGDPAMVALLASFLFTRPTHLINIVDRSGRITAQSWTESPIAGNRLADKPAYLLTSHETFSGAEEFSYVLHLLQRATLVGETTAGGAHLGSWHRIDAHFGMGIPDARPVSPISGTDWEGAGVEPDVPVNAAGALATAERLAAARRR